MQLNPSDPTTLIAVFGRQVEDFLNTDLGMYLSQCAEEDRKKAFEELRTVNPFADDGMQKVAAAQHKLRIAECFMAWVAEAVAKGLQATQQLQEDA
jgi:hypothetical protein